MADRRKSIEVFGISFLDLICCGLGSVVVLMLIFSALARDGGASRRLLQAVYGEQEQSKRNKDDFFAMELRLFGQVPVDIKLKKQVKGVIVRKAHASNIEKKWVILGKNLVEDLPGMEVLLEVKQPITKTQYLKIPYESVIDGSKSQFFALKLRNLFAKEDKIAWNKAIKMLNQKLNQHTLSQVQKDLINDLQKMGWTSAKELFYGEAIVLTAMGPRNIMFIRQKNSILRWQKQLGLPKVNLIDAT